MNKGTVIVTGGSSGIGFATVRLFAQKGYTVYDFSRHGKECDGVKHVKCDVTSYEDCRVAVDRVVEESGSIDILISNAGMGVSGAVEFTTTDDVYKQMNVNFFGAVNITQAVLPYMRRSCHGHIIFVSSMASVFAIPFQAFYSASKYAINGFAMSLRNEVRPFGIDVTCLLPGDVKTAFTDSRCKEVSGAEVYKNMRKAISTMEHDEINGISPQRIARKLLSMAETKHPKAFYTVGAQYKMFLLLNKLIPATLVYKIVGKMYGG